VQGDHCFLPGGNARLVAALAEGVPIFYGSAVKRISYRPQGVAVTVKGDTVYKADACLCTVPLGVLKVRTRLPYVPGRKDFSALSRFFHSQRSRRPHECTLGL